jgi:hypothetical protein
MDPATGRRSFGWINIYKDGQGSMQLEKQPFDMWPEQI